MQNYELVFVVICIYVQASIPLMSQQNIWHHRYFSKPLVTDKQEHKFMCMCGQELQKKSF